MPADSISLIIALEGHESTAETTQLHALAQQLNLSICNLSNPETCRPFHFCLSFINPKMVASAEQGSEKILSLSSNQDDFQGMIHIDFVHGKLGHRRQFGGGRGQPLAKAIGLKHGINPTVIDATAGLGRDAYVLASLGAKVTMIERSPILAALLENGLKRLATEPELPETNKTQLNLIHDNAIEWLKQHAEAADHERPDVVYLDPMYPHRSKSALVKKEMRALRALVGDDEDASLLLQAARQCAKKRVVVKRPKTAPSIDNIKPSGNVHSKNTRYDIYAVTSVSQ